LESVEKILLVEPDFPIAKKSKNHSRILPIGLLKLASHYRNKNCFVKLNRGNFKVDFCPDRILITSLFTYWAKDVKDSVDFYKSLYPDSVVVVGGIYASLMPEHCLTYTGCDEVHQGQHTSAEKCIPAYDLVDVDYQIMHGMRGCPRSCSFCGIWRLERESYKTAEQIKNEISSNHLVFYDNNFLANPNIENILTMLAETQHNSRVIKCDAQSGIDGRILEKKPHLARMLKNARFRDIRIAWDFNFNQHDRIEKWIEILKDAGYNHRTIFIFMIHNWDFDYNHMEMKRKKCLSWNIQIADCRYRPLDCTHDRYSGNSKNQSSEDYFIHPSWTDKEVKQFRANVRKHNICIRYKIPWDNYSRKIETSAARRLVSNTV